MSFKATTLMDVFSLVLEHDLQDAMRWRTAPGQYADISAKEVYRRVILVAGALQGWGIHKGDRTSILSENRPEWAIADFASLMIGAVDVPIYATLLPEQIAYILKDSGARVIFLSTVAQLDKVLSIREQTAIERIVVIEEIGNHPAKGRTDVISMSELITTAPYAHDAALDALALSVQPDDLATIIYTSGTTGNFKGVQLTHWNIVSNLVCSAENFGWSRKPGYISFLPLSHITARHVDYVMLAMGVGISYCPSFDDLGKMVQEVRPHNFVGVPRVYEKIRQEVERRTGRGFKKLVFEWATRIGRAHREEILSGNIPQTLGWKLANALAFSKVKRALGGMTDACISGGAPLSLEVAQWYADMGIRIFEGYGLTETSPVIAVNTMSAFRLGSVGRPLPNIECKVASDGELLVRGPSVTKGYWQLPEETKSSFEDGWFKTGDIVKTDADGFIFVTDRKKDLIKTSGGKFIAPQPIENLLKANLLIAQAAIVGDRRKFVSVIIAPNFPMLEDWAHSNSIHFANRKELVRNVKVRTLYEGIVEQLNSKLARFETLKKIILVPDEFTIESGDLTPSMKLRRRVVEKKYVDLVEQVYADSALFEPAGAN